MQLGKEFHILGVNADVDTGSEDVVAAGGTYAFPAAAAATKVLSSSADDDTGGTGAITVKITGLNADLRQIEETATLNGTADVILTNSFLRINNVEVLTAGSGGTNAGAITVQHAATVLATVPIAAGRSQTGVFTAPAGMVSRIKAIRCAITNAVSGAVAFTVWTRKSGGVFQARMTVGLHGTAQPNFAGELGVGITLEPGEDVKIRATASADNSAVSAGLGIIVSSSPVV